jgi:6-phosphogluconolactonase (cycloisomerase 2 family)
MHAIHLLHQTTHSLRSLMLALGTAALLAACGGGGGSATTQSFLVGGTATGLTGSGLVLAVNGGDTLAVGGNGAFSFSQPLASGTAYAVTVSEQPSAPQQNCSVSNGSGSVGAANVTSVQVSCTTDSYTVGGNVSGLAGSGLVLEDNGGDDLSVSAAGSFTFATSVASGGAYAVTVKTQPVNPAQTCSVSAGSGTIATGNVGSVVVTCTTTTFGVGGTVTGLLGSGLVLQTNGGNNAAISSGGSYTFATLASGTAYTVTVLTQPTSPSQTCTVANGSGTLGTASVTNVQIACTTNQYSVAGSVSGLAGSGLVLQVASGAANVPVSGNGAVSFGNLPSFTGYAVAVVTQPSNPTQTCTVANGTGTVTNAPITSISISCTTNHYTVGGSVSGLAGSGLILTTNGGTPVSVSTNGSFTFATLNSGVAYTLAVQTQPSNLTQLCSVANATGTVTNANISNIAITCVTSQFSIGGTISGLSGTGLVITDNGTDTLSSPSSPFTFGTTIASGSPYSVAFTTQPTNPWQTCAFPGNASTASGTVTNANIALSISCTTNHYNLGGSVTGLAGSGLVLHIGGGVSNVPVSGSPWSVSVLSNTSYNVSVVTQPTSPTQNCVPSNTTGTVTNTAISNVNIVCTTYYTISGTVTHLNGSGLVLQNNGTTVPVSGGSFSFQVNSGSAYALTVNTQPSSPAQRCIVSSNGSGTANANVSNVTVNCLNTGQYVFATNPFDNNQVFDYGSVAAFTIDPSSGALTPAAGSPFQPLMSVGQVDYQPTALAVDPSGQYLYVANYGSYDVATWGIGAGGVLTPDVNAVATGTSTNEPVSILLDPAGPYVYVGSLDSPAPTVEGYTIAGGVLSAQSGSPASPYLSNSGEFSMAVDYTHAFMWVAANYDGVVTEYAIGAGGALTQPLSSPFTTLNYPFGIAASPNAAYVYVTDQGGPGPVSSLIVGPTTGTVNVLSYDNTGTLTLVNSYGVGVAPEGVAVDPTGSYVYVSNTGDGTVSAFSTGANGTLTAVAGSPFSTTGSPSLSNNTTLQVDPSGQFLYVVNGDSGNVSAFTIGAGGVLTPVTGSPYASIHFGGGPNNLAIF